VGVTLLDHGQPPCVLFVDDDPDMRAMYGGRLRADGFDVRFAADGPAALDAAARPLDIVLLDVRMPGMDGLEVLRRLKRDAGMAEVPVVMLSNECEEAAIGRARAMGAVAWWTKIDVLPAELSRRVGALLETKPDPAGATLSFLAFGRADPAKFG
jgi:two-component system, OmpR family, response regulator ResD